MNEEEHTTTLWKRYQDSLNYIRRMKLDSIWEECHEFVEGKHWPKATKRTAALPRPVINLCSMIADNKKASILSTKIKMIYRPSEVFFDFDSAKEGANLFTKFAENISKELRQEDLDDRAQEFNTQLGSFVFHYYWDREVVGGMQSPYIGALRGQVLEPKYVFVSNPLQKDEQKQDWIQIISSEPLKSVRDLAKKNGVKNWDKISADTEIDEKALKDKEVCTVITQYSRVNGKVVWEKATQNVQIQLPTYWEPGLGKVKNSADLEETNEPDVAQKSGFQRKQLYPIVFGDHKSRNNCIYGIGEVEQVIPNNKALNFMLGMMLLSVQQTAWPKMIQKVGALARQVVTNEPGQMLIDYSRSGSGWGVSYLNTPGFNPQVMQLTNVLVDLTRSTTGSTEVATGEVIGANMAASAIIALQNQAKKPIETYQKKYYRCYEKIGAIWLQFFKYYYNDGRLFSYEEEGEQFFAEMNGKKYENFDYAMSIEVGSGGNWSESLSISLLDALKTSQDIDTDEYIELYPESVMPFKSRLKQLRAKKLEEQQKQMLQSQATQVQPTQEIVQ